jgi:hypothetical protein
MRRFVLLLSLVLSACITCGPPRDVRTFVERRDTCDHWRGEAGDYNGDTEREREVNEGVAKFCTGTDKELAILRLKYIDDQQVIQILSKYMTRIETKRK